MAETYRKGKVVEYIKRLNSRKQIITTQLNQGEFICIRENLLGQVQSLDLTIKELMEEFDITEF